MTTYTQSTNPTRTLKELLEIVNPATGTFCCVGWAPSKGRRCQQPVNQYNRRTAHAILDSLPSLFGDEQMLRAKLKELASLAICVRFHQDQASRVGDRWYRIIADEYELDACGPGVAEDLEDEIARLQRELEEMLRRREEQRRYGEGRNQQERRQQNEARRRAEAARQEDARRQEEEEARRRQEEARHHEEEARRREEEEIRQQEEARRQQEEARQRQEDARRQREAHQRADAQARAQRMRRERERVNAEWAESWTRYERDWEHMRRVNTSSLDEEVRESVPWPVKSGKWQDVNESNVRAFFRHAPDEASENPRRLRSVLRRQAKRWHEDKLRHFFERVAGDEACLRLAKMVMQVVNDLMGPLSSL